MKHLVIGTGEVGTAISKIFQCDIVGKVESFNSNFSFDIIHICFPYSEDFIDEVKRYQELYKVKYTIIHSTVPVGTSRKLNAIHSPILGIHPYLEESIKTFTKYLGGENASEVADEFRRAGMKVYITDKSETTELMKILCTTKYGLDIEWVKDVKDQCNKYKVPFEFYSLWTDNYNMGYNKLGQSQFTRPNLIPIKGKIKGHCVRPNLELLETKFTKLLKEFIMDTETKQEEPKEIIDPAEANVCDACA